MILRRMWWNRKLLKIDRYKIYFYQLFVFLNDDVDLADDAIVDRRQIKENTVPIERIINLVIDNNTEDLEMNFLFLYQSNASDQIFLER